MDITITSAVIVKDEERCIDSLLPIFDEIIIIDTGSVDNTLNILGNYASDKLKIYHALWKNDFSKPRNLAIKKAKCDYIFFIDADEYINSSKCEVITAFDEINRNSQKNNLALCPNIQDHNSNVSSSVRRGFINNKGFYYFGYVHEELRKNSCDILDVNVNINIIHDGYCPEIIDGKDKKRRNYRLNLKNINAEPLHLRWRFFYYRDSFEDFAAEDIYHDLSEIIKINAHLPLQISNLKSEQYIFSILDLIARAKLKLRDDHDEFHRVISVMNEVIPFNSNGFYYSMVYEIFNWKDSVKKRIEEILDFKRSECQYNIDMLHSDGLHIDAVLSFYLYEIGMNAKAKELLLSVKSCGFHTELIDSYLRQMSYNNNEE